MENIEIASIQVSIVFLVILALIRIARDTEFYSPEVDLEEIVYDDGNWVLQITSRFPLFSDLAGIGYSYVLFYIIEYAFVHSTGMIFSEFVPQIPLSDNSIGVFLILVITGLWVVYPLLAIPEYNKIIQSGYRPRSLDYHVFMTVLLLALQAIRFKYDLTARSADDFLSVGVQLVILSIFVYKVITFT